MICSVTPSPRLPAVDVGGVEEVDAQLQRPVHDGEAVGFGGLRAEVHRAQAQPADLQPGAAEIDVLHVRLPSSCGYRILPPPIPKTSRSPKVTAA